MVHTNTYLEIGLEKIWYFAQGHFVSGGVGTWRKLSLTLNTLSKESSNNDVRSSTEANLSSGDKVE